MQAKIFFGSTETTKKELSERRSPFDDKVVSTAPICNAEDTIKALKIAQTATPEAKASTISQRCNWLLDVAAKLKENREDIARTITDEVGKPLMFSRVEVDRAIETVTLSAETMRTMHGETINTDAMPSGKKTISYFFREPVGVVSAITPFNFPLNLVAHKLAPALVSGNCVVLKPTPEAPLTAYKFARLFIESEYAVKDALSVVYGDVEVGSTFLVLSVLQDLYLLGILSRSPLESKKYLWNLAGMQRLLLIDQLMSSLQHSVVLWVLLSTLVRSVYHCSVFMSTKTFMMTLRKRWQKRLQS
jgi:acyl-CoA reductase-like NAD-dependent aldehyde dehydrogenase